LVPGNGVGTQADPVLMPYFSVCEQVLLFVELFDHKQSVHSGTAI